MTFALHPSTGWVFPSVIHRKLAAFSDQLDHHHPARRCFEVLQRCIAQALRVALPTLRFYDDVPCEQLTSLVRFDLANTLVEGLQSGLKASAAIRRASGPRIGLRGKSYSPVIERSLQNGPAIGGRRVQA